MVALRQYIQQGIKPPVLIFVESIERANELFHELVYDGINVEVIHSDKTKTQVRIECPVWHFSDVLTMISF